MTTTKKIGKKFQILVLMMLSSATIYILPFLRYSFHIPLQEAMDLVEENSKFGALTSMYGITNILLYIPGGWMADRFDPKKLLVFSMISTGILGFWLSTWPSYPVLLLIHALFGVTTVLTFWSASIKCINVISASDEQGSMFGGLEAGRCIVSLIVTTIFLGIYAWLQEDSSKAMSGVVICCSSIMILVGIALAYLMPQTNTSGDTNTTLKESFNAMGKAFKMPITYILAGLLFCAQMCSQVGSYYSPYLKDGFNIGVMTVTIFSNYRTIFCGFVGGIISIYFAKKVGRSARVIVYAGVCAIIINAILFFASNSTALVWPMVIIMIMSTVCNNIFRSLDYAVIDESGTQKNVVGSVIGVASLIGFLPDAFSGSLCGFILDNYGFDGYKGIFFMGILAVMLGLICAILGDRETTKYRNSISTLSPNNKTK